MHTRVLVTGASGMVGQHLRKRMPGSLHVIPIFISSKDYDLRDSNQVKQMYSKYNPDGVIHLAAKVGGIMDNIKDPVGFYEDNILMNTNVLSWAYKHGVKKFIGVLSTCIYPDKVSDFLYPMRESHLHDGPPTPTNFSYGYAKRCLAVQIDTYNKQYGTKYNYVIPCNLYSELDHFVGDKAHFVTSLIHKIALAKINKENSITLFGTGQPLRQFMYAGDLANIIVKTYLSNVYANFNVCGDETYTIKQIAEIALDACNANELMINWDNTKPDGQYRKDVSNTKLKEVFPNFKFTSLKDGIKLVYEKHYNELATK